jgi:hypothetical protein
LLDQIGEALEPKLVGSWIGVWGGKVTTGWHFLDPHPWPKVEAMFGTHEAKYQIKKWVEDHRVERIERFLQAIGDSPYSEIELAVPGTSVEEQVATLSAGFAHFTGTPLDRALIDRLRAVQVPAFALALRIRAGKIVRVGALAPGITQGAIDELCRDACVGVDRKLERIVGALGGGIARVEYGRAGERAGVDVYLEPSEPLPTQGPAAPSEAN